MSGTGKTKQELEDILIKVAKVRHIINYKSLIDITPSKTEGFLSELYTGEITNHDNGETTFVAIKIVPKQAGIFENFAEMYRNEVNFYANIFPELDKFQKNRDVLEVFDQIPTYFLGNLEPGTEYVVMENVVAKGYKLREKTGYFDRDHLDLTFKFFGKLHALALAFKQQKPNEYKNMLTQFTDIFQNKDENDALYESIANNVTAGFEAFDVDNDEAVYERLTKIGGIQKVLTKLNKYDGKYKCIIHGDCWSNNLLFKYADSDLPIDVKLVDFQMLRETTPVHDLSFLFYSGASNEELANLDYYLERYYHSFTSFAKQLQSDPEELFTFEAVKHDWNQYGLLGVFLALDLLVLKLIKPEKALEMRNMEEVDKEAGLKMWDEEIARIRTTKEFADRSKAVILSAFRHGLI